MSILFLAMYLFSTFNNNTNFILNKEKEYKELVYMAEKELNLELDNIKNGKFNTKDKFESSSNPNKVMISKRIDIIDKPRGVYLVTIDLKKGDESIKLQGYERYAHVE